MAATDFLPSGIPLLPRASRLAEQVDMLFLTLTGVELLMVLVLFGLIVGFAVRYRRGARANPARPVPERRLELAWTLALLAVFLGVFAWSGRIYVEEESSPAGSALEIQGRGKQWMWKFTHPNGRREINELHLPLGSPVRVVLASRDVIHSFYVPAFRIKQDVVPGRFQAISFTPSRMGRYRLFCAEYCGLDHSRMAGDVVVMAAADYQAWLAGTGGETVATQGEALYARLGCGSCHGAGSATPAPSLAGLFGKPVRLADGRIEIAGEDYLRDSILTPGKDVVAGFQPVMPNFQRRLTESELMKLIAYLKSLSDREGPP